MNETTLLQTPIGPLTILAGPDGVRRIEFGDAHTTLPDASGELPAGAASEFLGAAVAQLHEYFAGERQAFDLVLDLGGTPFQRGVWASLQEISYGATTTYGTLAGRFWADPVQARLHARAIGAAVGATPVPIVVPCHRVLGADGSLTGYRGGLPIKRALLDFEASGGSRQAISQSGEQKQLALL